MQKYKGAEQNAKENWEVRENRKRQMELELMEKEQGRMAQHKLASEIKGQMEYERIRRNHKSILQLGQMGRHNPITNPIEYHIDNPYILKNIQDRENWIGQQWWSLLILSFKIRG